MRELTAQQRRSWTRARAGAVTLLALALVALGLVLDDGAPLAPLGWLIGPGMLWVLWVSAGLAADQREDRTESWRWQSGRRPLSLALQGSVGAATPGLVLILLGTLGTLFDHETSEMKAGIAKYGMATLPWILAAAVGLTALGRWRRNAEPRARHGWRGRIVVMIALGLIIVIDAGVHAGAALAVDPYSLTWWGAKMDVRTWFTTGAVASLVCFSWAAARAERGTRGIPWAWVAWVNAGALWISGLGSTLNEDVIGPYVALGWVCACSVLTVLVQPNEAVRTEESPVTWAAASVAFWTVAASTYLWTEGVDFWEVARTSGALMTATVGAYVVRDLAVFEALRRVLSHERQPGIMWLGWLIASWGALPVVAAKVGLHPGLSGLIAPPWPSIGDGLQALQWPILGAAVVSVCMGGIVWVASGGRPPGVVPVPVLRPMSETAPSAQDGGDREGRDKGE